MKDEYILYLDESELKLSKTFGIAGIAIKKDKISILEQGIKEVKKILWKDEYLSTHKPVLHCTELQKVYNNRTQKNISNVKEEYEELFNNSEEDIEKKYKQVYGKLCQILKQSEATIFTCIIKLKQLRDLYYVDDTHDGIHLIDDKYNIALQKVIENYTHYLVVNDGYGDVVYESRNNIGENSEKSPDVKLINDYHKIQANNKGIVYTNSVSVQSRNRTIVVYSKNENLPGLEIADFVANNILKFEQCKIPQQITDFMKLIHRLSYNGGHTLEEKDQRSFWGLKVLPSYLYMEELIKENKKLKNSYASLRKEKNKLKKSVENRDKQIEELNDKIQFLFAELKKVNDQID